MSVPPLPAYGSTCLHCPDQRTDNHIPTFRFSTGMCPNAIGG
jgi:hypothetical protein